MGADNMSQALFEAIRASNVEGVKNLLGSGVSANSQDPHGQTALQFASSLGNIAVVETLIAAKANVNPTPKPLTLDPKISAPEIPNGGNFAELLAQATENADAEAKNFYAGFIEFVDTCADIPEDLAGKDSLHEEENAQEEEEATTPLMAAVIGGHLHVVRVLLQAGAMANPPIWHETPPLIVAARKGHTAIVHELLAAGAEVERGFDCTPLGEAVRNGHTEIVRVLIAAGADVNQPVDEDEGTALMDAAYFGHLEIVKLLVKAGADVNAWGQGDTPLLRAAAGGWREIYDFLYPLVAEDIRRRGDKEGDKTIAKVLKQRERERNQAVEKFIAAAMCGDVAEVEKAIANDIDVNAIGSNGCTALMYAASYGHRTVVQALLDAGADPNIFSDSDNGLGERMTALMEAAGSFFAKNRHEIVKLLIAAGADVNLKGEGGQTALMCAVNYVESVKALIAAGADVNAHDDEGNSVLMLAQVQGFLKVVDVLKQAGASEAGIEQITLIEAARSGDLEIVKTLIQNGVNVNYSDGEALESAVGEGDREMVELLIQAGADVNLGAEAGFTPLARAAYEGYVDIVQLLIAAGADVHARTFDGNGNNALEYTEIGMREGHHKGDGHKEIIGILQQAGLTKF